MFVGSKLLRTLRRLQRVPDGKKESMGISESISLNLGHSEHGCSSLVFVYYGRSQDWVFRHSHYTRVPA